MKGRKNKQRKWKQFFLPLSFCFFAVGMIACVVSVFRVWKNTRDYDGVNYSQIEMEQPKIQKEFLTPNQNSRPELALHKVKGIVIHYTANPGTDAQANRDYFESRKDCGNQKRYKVSSHFIIGLDGTIIQCIPLDEIAYASNERNQDTISIECCHPDKTGKFTTQTRKSLLWLAAWLCDTYEIKKKQVIRHYDVSGKLCPLYYVQHPKAWDQLKDDIWKKLKKRQSA